MTKAEALAIFAGALMREILREEEAPAPVALGPAPPLPEEANPELVWSQPRFDFDASNDVCEHGGVYIDRASCPVHGQEAQPAPTAEELDDITSEDAPGPLERAARIREQQERRQKNQRLFPEDLPMRGMGPPPEEGE